MQKFTSEIYDFLYKNSDTIIIQQRDGFPFSPFEYIHLINKGIVLHCVSNNNTIEDGSFFQKLSLEFSAHHLKLIHLWEDVWETKQDIVKSRLLALLGATETIPARLTQVRRIDKVTLGSFLVLNHLQDSTTAKFKYGVFLPKRYFRVIDFESNLIIQSLQGAFVDSDEVLVAVISFSGARKFIREGEEFRSYELIRFANLRGVTVIGGFDKLLQAFIREQQPDDIMTYADADWSDGGTYEKLGFERIELTPPQEFWLDKQTLTRFYPHRLNQIEERFIKVYNSGNWKFLLKLKTHP